MKHTKKLEIFLFILLAAVAATDRGVAADAPLSIYFVDVGLGNATLFHQPGKCAMLIDSGPADQGESLRSVLAKTGIQSLDYVVVTQPTPENYFGLQIIFSDVQIKELSDSGDEGRQSEAYKDYRQLQTEAPYSVLAAGDSWQCGDITVDVLSPSPDSAGSGNSSMRAMALRAGYSTFKVLLMGDLTGAGEKDLLSRKENLKATILKVGHYGAADGTSSALLDRVKPQLAIISVNKHNDLNAPAESVLRRLDEHKIPVYRTDLYGTIHIRVNQDGTLRLSKQGG